MGPYLEYAALSWMSCAAQTSEAGQHQRRALRLGMLRPPNPPTHQPSSSRESSRSRNTGEVAAFCGIPQGTGGGSATRAGLDSPEVPTRSTRRCLPGGGEGGAALPRATRTNAPLGPRLPGVEHFFRPLSLNPEMNTQSNWQPIGGGTVEAHPR
ncbi:hypothetical protein GWK47_000338 [Chionoecetes opilio]|uniref:Uncharacterized protein n=1 Tax=Chionoecetes opilio TaxID=41210 RepID=A0A8J4YVH3_CHIOP|nr:hypothetical protein GWK47_000338 [Chionoecetes opilio]